MDEAPAPQIPEPFSVDLLLGLRGHRDGARHLLKERGLKDTADETRALWVGYADACIRVWQVDFLIVPGIATVLKESVGWRSTSQGLAPSG